METIILYWIFSIFYCLGMDMYKGKLSFSNLLVCVLYGWCMMPTSLGSAQGKKLDNN